MRARRGLAGSVSAIRACGAVGGWWAATAAVAGAAFHRRLELRYPTRIVVGVGFLLAKVQIHGLAKMGHAIHHAQGLGERSDSSWRIGQVSLTMRVNGCPALSVSLVYSKTQPARTGLAFWGGHPYILEPRLFKQLGTLALPLVEAALHGRGPHGIAALVLEKLRGGRHPATSAPRLVLGADGLKVAFAARGRSRRIEPRDLRQPGTGARRPLFGPRGLRGGWLSRGGTWSAP